MSELQQENNIQYMNVDLLEGVTNKLYLYGSLEEDNCFEFIRELHCVVDNMLFHKTHNLQLFDNKFKNELIIYLSTSGGSLWDAFSVYQAIREASSHFKIIIHCYGKIMSAGLLILAAGDERITQKSTTFMIHEAATDLVGQTSHLSNELEDLKKVYNKYFEILTKRFKNDTLKDLIKPNLNTYFSANKAKELGIITKLIKDI